MKSTLVVTMLTCALVGSSVYAQTLNFDAISYNDIASTTMSTLNINGSNNSLNNIPAGTILVYKTDAGRYGKMQVTGYGYNMTLKWKTYNSNATTYTEGSNLVIRGTWSCDLDQGVETSVGSDFWWQQATSVVRYLSPTNGASFAVYDPAFTALTLTKIQSIPLFSGKIDGSDNSSNQIPTGTILVYVTDAGRYGKLKIVNYGFNLTLKWKTYNSNATPYSEGGDLVVRGTKSCDLDQGVETTTGSDFWWEHVSAVTRNLVPQNGARFAVQVTTRLTGNGSKSPGGSHQFTMSSPANPGLAVQLGTSLGNGPTPIGSRSLGLTVDNVLIASLSNTLPLVFASYTNALSATGRASAQLNIPPLPALIGLDLYHAFVVIQPTAPQGIQAISNTYTFRIGP